MIEELKMWFFRLNKAVNIRVYSNLIRRLRLITVSIFLVSLSALAQAPQDTRIALVIGNSDYRNAPELINPKNDARAISLILKKLGFEVINVNDGTKEEILSGIVKMQSALKGRQAIGMLYYAGHGIQSNWRNYIIPVDINLGKGINLSQQAVDVDVVLSAFKNSGTKMNIIVLDACRDNPFGDKSGAKGLAQVDAPPNTYIAFATSPGNVAKDGDDSSGNGLFTGYMIKELLRPAPIEDMFKRVRLQVRKASQGTQIPWDSSSLEIEFSFNDGVKYTLNPIELSRELTAIKVPDVIIASQPIQKINGVDDFQSQKSEWDKIKDSRNPNDFYAYLNKYPNGYISQEAIFKLNQVSKINVTAIPDMNGITQPPDQKRYRVGDEYERVTKDSLTGKVLSKGTSKITKIENGLVYFRSSSGKEGIVTEAGGIVRANNPEATYTFDPPLPNLPADEFQVGKKWTSETYQTSNSGTRRRTDKFIVDRVEDVTVPAGTFKAFVVEREAVIGNKGEISTSQNNTYWYVPGIGVPVKNTRNNIQNVLFNAKERREVTELISFKKGG